MKKIKRAMLLTWHYNGLSLLFSLEQLGIWLITCGVDWTKLPWAFCGSVIAMLKSRKDEHGQPVHKPLWEWAASVLGSTVVAMAAWKDTKEFTHLTPEFSTVVAGLLAWWLCDYILDKAKKKGADNTLTTKP